MTESAQISATVYLRVLHEMKYPLPAKPFNVLALVRLPNNLCVFDAACDRILAERAYPESRVMQTLRELVDIGFVEPLNPSEAALFASPPRPVLVAPSKARRPSPVASAR